MKTKIEVSQKFLESTLVDLEGLLEIMHFYGSGSDRKKVVKYNIKRCKGYIEKMKGEVKWV